MGLRRSAKLWKRSSNTSWQGLSVTPMHSESAHLLVFLRACGCMPRPINFWNWPVWGLWLILLVMGCVPDGVSVAFLIGMALEEGFSSVAWSNLGNAEATRRSLVPATRAPLGAMDLPHAALGGIARRPGKPSPPERPRRCPQQQSRPSPRPCPNTLAYSGSVPIYIFYT